MSSILAQCQICDETKGQSQHLDPLRPRKAHSESMALVRKTNRPKDKGRILGTSGTFIKYSLIGLAVLGAGTSGYWFIHKFVGVQRKILSKDRVARALYDGRSFFELPNQFELEIDEGAGRMAVQPTYAFDPSLQKEMESIFRSYTPDYGAFVALDASTGKVLSLVSYTKRGIVKENLALRATFPSASVFKLVTAAAAIEARKYSANTVIPFNGRNHTLYRGQVLRNTITRWTRYITLREAFARSVNTVFGRLGAFTLGATELREYADRFGFNRRIASDVPMQQGSAKIPDDPFGLAESASGFTRENTMSPLQGALMAAAIANDGVMMEPYVVERLTALDGSQVYQAQPQMAVQAVDPGTAAELRSMMRDTILRGTSQGSFKRFFRKEFAFVDVGGKTGSLTGTDPRGKYDWFVGYAEGGAHRIALCALTIHEKYWRVKSSYLARRAIEAYFGPRLRKPHVAAHDSTRHY